MSTFHEDSVDSFLLVKGNDTDDHKIWSCSSDGSINVWNMIPFSKRKSDISAVTIPKLSMYRAIKKDTRKSIHLEDYGDDDRYFDSELYQSHSLRNQTVKMKKEVIINFFFSHSKKKN